MHYMLGEVALRSPSDFKYKFFAGRASARRKRCKIAPSERPKTTAFLQNRKIVDSGGAMHDVYEDVIGTYIL